MRKFLVPFAEDIVKFEQIYGLAHAGRSLLMDTAIFGGANGWWRTDLLRQLGFDKSMLTEDIDISMRAMLSGHKIIHDRSVMSNELAPTSWHAWWKQRTRWAQGWLQVTMRHQRPLLASPILPWPLKIYWSILLTWREIFPIIAIQIVTLVASDLITTGTVQVKADPLAGLSLFLTLASGGLSAWATWRLSTPETRASQGPWRYALFGATAGLYTLVKNTVALVALAREALGDHRWVVTARTIAPAAAGATGPALLGVLVAGAALLGAGAVPHSAAAAATAAATPTTGVSATSPITQRAPTTGPMFAPDFSSVADAATATPAPSAIVGPRRTVDLVGEQDQPVTLDPSTTRVIYNLAVPGYWSSVSGTMILNLDGAPELSELSRIEVTINGRQVAAGRADPDEKSIQVPIPNLAVGSHNLQVVIDTTLRTTLSTCPPIGDPTAKLQVLPGTKVLLTPVFSNDLGLRDLPGGLISALGNDPSAVSVRFAHPATPAAITAAGVAAGAIAEARGYPGVRVRVVDGRKRPTILIDDRPGLARMRLSVRHGRPTLILAGDGKALSRVALMLTGGQLDNVKSRILENPDGTAAGRDLLPQLITLKGDAQTAPGRSVATTTFNLPGRYQVRRGARLRFTGSVESPSTTRASVSINGRRLMSRVDSSTGMPLRIDTLLAGRGPSYLLGDLRPGDNQIQVKAAALGSPRFCATQSAIVTTIDPAGTLKIESEHRPLSNTSLADWPFPLDRGPNWTGAQVVVPDGATGRELANVIAVLAESARLDGEPALPTIVTTMPTNPTNPTVPTLILARPGSVPAGLAAGIKGGVDAGTLAFRASPAGSGVVIAVGSRALLPLTAGYSSTNLNAVTVDVSADGDESIRTPYTPVVTSTKPLPAQVKWPLIVLGLSMAWLFVMSLRATHRRAKKMMQSAGSGQSAGAGAGSGA